MEEFIQSASSLFLNVIEIRPQQLIMWLIGAILIYLAIKKNMEPTLLLPMGFGAILVNLPNSGAVTPLDAAGQFIPGEEKGIIDVLFGFGIVNELFPLLLFIGIGAMIDFGPLLSNPKMLLFGAAAQFGIFFTLSLAALMGFRLEDAASIGIIGAADGTNSIFISNYFNSEYAGVIAVAAYSYMALVPIIQPPVIKLITTRKERLIRMEYKEKSVSKATRILFPIIITVIAGLVAPRSVALIGFLMFGNLIRECGVLKSLSESAQKELANLITLLLGLTIATRMQADQFLKLETLFILGLGLVAFVFDTIGGVFFAKFLNLFTKNKINPMIGATGISAFPMSARVIHKMGLAEDPQNFLLMHAVG
ncbi:MAG: sodium ion-translocating decarboxylase, beta subunit, partial [Clostridia bacterium]|nr:sodium ion-translocating decarboxylase, beta subunit [Clostridia bacterium]